MAVMSENRYRVLVGCNTGCTPDNPEGKRLEPSGKWLRASAIGNAGDIAALLQMGAIEAEAGTAPADDAGNEEVSGGEA